MAYLRLDRLRARLSQATEAIEHDPVAARALFEDVLLAVPTHRFALAGLLRCMPVPEPIPDALRRLAHRLCHESADKEPRPRR